MSEFSSLRKIYVVDDERSVAMTLVRILRYGGYDATPFTNPQDALVAARANPPQLLLAEADLPSLSGTGLGVAVRDNWPNCKVLLMSGTVTMADSPGTVQSRKPEFEVLEKPIHMAALLGKVQRVIGGAKPPQVVRPSTMEKCCA